MFDLLFEALCTWSFCCESYWVELAMGMLFLHQWLLCMKVPSVKQCSESPQSKAALVKTHFSHRNECYLAYLSFLLYFRVPFLLGSSAYSTKHCAWFLVVHWPNNAEDQPVFLTPFEFCSLCWARICKCFWFLQLVSTHKMLCLGRAFSIYYLLCEREKLFFQFKKKRE